MDNAKNMANNIHLNYEKIVFQSSSNYIINFIFRVCFENMSMVKWIPWQIYNKSKVVIDSLQRHPLYLQTVNRRKHWSLMFLQGILEENCVRHTPDKCRLCSSYIRQNHLNYVPLHYFSLKFKNRKENDLVIGVVTYKLGNLNNK